MTPRVSSELGPGIAVMLALGAMTTGGLVGCGSGDDLAAPGLSAPSVVATEAAVATTRTPPVTINVTLPPTTEAASGDGENVFGGDDPEDQLMPDVVCMNLQDAQNEIQDHGVFFSRSEDATGEGRRQILDRNWTVVAQEPAAGTAIGEFEAVLYVVKSDEDPAC